jgi:hypothetical protein
MILLNFSHPLSNQHLAQIEALSGQHIEQVIALPVQFDSEQSFLPQLAELMEQIPISAQDLQTKPILVNPPALNFITALLLAELHGRMGYFPPIVRTSPVPNSLPPVYEVAEILNLQNVRDSARKSRF